MGKRNEVVKETILFILESTLFTFSIFGSWVMEHSLGIDYIIEISVQCCIIAFYFIRLWGSRELKEQPFDLKLFSIALIPVLLTVALNGFKIQTTFSWRVLPLCLITATCEEMHFRVNGCHLFREDGILGIQDCAVLILVFSVCRIFSFIVQGIPLSVMSVMESLGTGTLLLGYYLKTGNTKSLILLHTLVLTAEQSIFKHDIPAIELVSVLSSITIGNIFIRNSLSSSEKNSTV